MASVEQLVDHDHHGGRRVDVIAHITGHDVQDFHIGSDARLWDVMDKAAQLAGVALLPPKERPFDELHSMNGEHVGPIIENLDQSLAEYMRHTGFKAHFAVKLALAFHVNTRWDVAPKKDLSPRDILALPRIHLDFTKFTLYRPESNDPLPLDTLIEIHRGLKLDAHSDGRYGGGC
jgi:hypothetical protein